MKNKYVVFEDWNGFKNMVIIPEYLKHSDITIKGTKPVSAGFIYTGIDDGDNFYVNCTGKSTSLNLKSNPDVDEKLFKKQICSPDY